MAEEETGEASVYELGGISTPPQSRTSSKVIEMKNEDKFDIFA